ncbi:MAG: hypothetical protein ABSC51_06405 [Gaiellaceae bacterium]
MIELRLIHNNVLRGRNQTLEDFQKRIYRVVSEAAVDDHTLFVNHLQQPYAAFELVPLYGGLIGAADSFRLRQRIGGDFLGYGLRVDREGHGQADGGAYFEHARC